MTTNRELQMKYIMMGDGLLVWTQSSQDSADPFVSIRANSLRHLLISSIISEQAFSFRNNIDHVVW